MESCRGSNAMLVFLVPAYRSAFDLDHGSAKCIHHPAYFPSHHPIASATDVMAIEIASDVAISFAHSQYDTHASSRLYYRTASSVELVCTQN
jgi:hypothetical protein